MKLFLPLLALLGAALAPAQMTTDQKVADFTSLSQFYVRHYTPANWKIVQFGFDLANIQPWLERVRATKNDIDYYDVVIDYVSHLRDGHVGFLVPSSYRAYLQFDVDIYDGKVLVDFISRNFDRTTFPLAVGDEILSVDGVGVQEWITRLSRYAEFGNPLSTRRQAADFITFRPQANIPWAAQIGETASVVIRRASGEEVTYALPWTKTGEPLVNLPPVSGPRLATQQSLPLRDHSERDAKRRAAWGLPETVAPAEAERLTAEEQEVRSAQIAEVGPHQRALAALGQTLPLYNPPAGFRLRRGAAQGDFYLSGTFPLDGKTIGWIRIPSFSPPNQNLALTQFRGEVEAMQQITDALVIDVQHNPGGNVCFAQEQLRYLVPTPFWGVGYWIKPTQSWVRTFESLASSTSQLPATDWRRVLSEEYFRLVKEAAAAGRETGIFPICSQSLITLPQDVVYTKPVLVLTNEFSLSAGDAFPALFQDARRGPIVGMRTGGLGGNVNSYNYTGVTEGTVAITRSLIIRENAIPSPFGPTRFIENVGVTPDVTLDIMTRENLLSDGEPFVNGWLNEVRKLLQ